MVAAVLAAAPVLEVVEAAAGEVVVEVVAEVVAEMVVEMDEKKDETVLAAVVDGGEEGPFAGLMELAADAVAIELSKFLSEEISSVSNGQEGIVDDDGVVAAAGTGVDEDDCERSSCCKSASNDLRY